MSERPERPPRPAVPLALWLLVVAVASERLVLWRSFAGDAPTLVRWAALLAGAALAVLLPMAMLARRGVHHLPGAAWAGIACLMVALLAGSSAALGAARQLLLVERLETCAVSGWELTTCSDVTPTAHGFSCRARVERAGEPSGEVRLTTSEELACGTRLCCVGRYGPPTDDDYGRSSWAQGVCGTVRVVRVRTAVGPQGPAGALARLRGHALAALDPNGSDVRALMAGCVCGWRVALAKRGLTDLFAACGVAHLVAVSGAHLALVSGVLARLLASTGWGRRGRLLILALASGLYVLLCGAPVSAVRAWLMSLAAFGADVAGRRSHPLSALGLVGLALTLQEPALSGQLGFLLSAGSVAALCLFGPHATYVLAVALPGEPLRRILPRRLVRPALHALDGLRQVAAATLVCQLATLPLTLPAFGSASLLAPLANVLVGPLVSVLMALGGSLCLLGWLPPLRSALLAAAELVGFPALALMRRLAQVPGAQMSGGVRTTVACVAVPILLLLWLLWWPRVTRRDIAGVLGGGGLALALLFVWWGPLAPARIVVLDVGQGDAILVQDGLHGVLVDTGPDASVVEALARMHVFHLDGVVITHLHDDHFGGLDDLVGHVGCSRVIVAQGVAAHLGGELAAACDALTAAPVIELACGDTLRVGRFSLRMVWPTAPVDGSVNAHSIELVARYEGPAGSLTALLTGDAERDETGFCVRAGTVGDIDLLKVGHHGSEASLTPELARALAPELAVASAGEGNSYGHPNPTCVRMLEEAGARFVCTKDVGDVDVRPGARGPRLRCSRSQPSPAQPSAQKTEGPPADAAQGCGFVA